MIALVSPTYVSSPWCTFEWGAMGGIHLTRGPKWPAIRPYIWKPMKDPEHFVGQVPYEAVRVDFDALVKYQPVPWEIRNPLGEMLYDHEKRKFSEFVGNVLDFIAQKYVEINPGAMSRLQP